MLRQASEVGQLYGSVSPRDIAGLLNDGGFEVDRNQIALNVPIKTIGSAQGAGACCIRRSR